MAEMMVSTPVSGFKVLFSKKVQAHISLKIKKISVYFTIIWEQNKAFWSILWCKYNLLSKPDKTQQENKIMSQSKLQTGEKNLRQNKG